MWTHARISARRGSYGVFRAGGWIKGLDAPCEQCKRTMAYALGFPASVTRQIEACRDWRLEEVKRRGGTPSRLGLLPFQITPGASPYREGAYFIDVKKRSFSAQDRDQWVLQRAEGVFQKLGQASWGEMLDNDNGYLFIRTATGSLMLQDSSRVPFE